MKKILLLIGIVTLFFSCKEKRPENILNEEQMISVVKEVQILDACFQSKGWSNLFNSPSYKHFYNHIFDSLQISPLQFDESLSWYARHDANALKEIYTKVDEIYESQKDSVDQAFENKRKLEREQNREMRKQKGMEQQ